MATMQDEYMRLMRLLQELLQEDQLKAQASVQRPKIIKGTRKQGASTRSRCRKMH